MRTVNESITPAKARLYLGLSRGNRPISKTFVNTYADAMKKGEWKLNGVPIVFDKASRLIDGHHRLHAVIQSGVTIESAVCYGAEEDSFATYDCGRKRSLAQLVAMEGTKNYNVIGGVVCAYLSLVESGRVYSNNTALGKAVRTNNYLYGVYEKDKQGFTFSSDFGRTMYGRSRMLKSSWIGAMHYYLTHDMGYSAFTVELFFDKLCSLSDSNVTTIDALRHRIMGDRMKNIKTDDATLFALTVKAWNYWISGKSVSRVVFDKNKETYPKFISQCKSTDNATRKKGR